MKTIIVSMLILFYTNSFCQTIEGLLINNKSKGILIEIMKASGVEKVYVSSTNRTIDEQVDEMYNYIVNHTLDSALRLYGKEGDKVVLKYSEGKGEKKSVGDIKALMKVELIKQLPSAIEHNSLMHVGREAEFSVFDISRRRLEPSSQLNEFENQAKKYQKEGKLHRFLGSENAEKDAFHFEINVN